MHVELNQVYSLTVTGAELRLIGLALAGKIKPEDVDAADKLNDSLLFMREKRLTEALAVVVAAKELRAKEKDKH